MQLRPETARAVSMSACVLHNLIFDRSPVPAPEVDTEDHGRVIVPSSWRRGENLLQRLMPRRGNVGHQAKAIRDYLTK